MVQYKETGNVQEDIAQLAQAPGLEWMAEIANRDDVDWQAVQEVHDKWSKSDSGLGMGVMLIVAIVASAVTAGAAPELALASIGLDTAMINGVSTIVVAGTTTAATSTQLALYSAITAGLTSLGAQVSVGLADAAAGGDLGDNLSDIVSIDGLRSLAASMVLAGTLSASSKSFAEMGEPGKYLAKIAIQTATDGIVGGEDLQESLLSAVGLAFGEYSAGKIDASEFNLQMKLLLHGAAGAVGAAVTGGDPYSGAMGAIVGELAALSIDSALFDGAGVDGGTDSLEGKTILAGSQIASVLAASLAGLDGGDAAATARNAVMNNYLMPQEKKELIDELNACGDDDSCKEDITAHYEMISEQRDDEFDNKMRMCKKYKDCGPVIKSFWDVGIKFTKEGNMYYDEHPEDFVLLPAAKSKWHTMVIDSVSGEPRELLTSSNGSKKYMHPIYGYEVVIDVGGHIDENAVNMGTWNKYNPGGYGPDNELITSTWNHFVYDVYPYILFGNSSEDKSSILDRLIRGLYIGD